MYIEADSVMVTAPMQLRRFVRTMWRTCGSPALPAAPRRMTHHLQTNNSAAPQGWDVCMHETCVIGLQHT